MRSISHFPSGANRRGRRKPKTQQSPPVWGRSAAAIVAISSSPSNSSYGSNDGESYGSSNSSTRSTSRSPVAKSPVLGRSVRTATAATRSPNFQKNQQQQQHRATGHNRSRSWSPSESTSLISIDDYRDEVITQSYHQQQLLAPKAISSSPRPHFRQVPSNELCTIAEDRRISSNTLSQMAVTSTAQQIAKSPVLAKRPLQPTQQAQHQPARKLNNSSRKFLDPYNNDDYTDYEDQDCADCWAYRKSGFRNWWPFKNDSDAITNAHQSRRRNGIVGFPARHSRIHMRRTSF